MAEEKLPPVQVVSTADEDDLDDLDGTCNIPISNSDYILLIECN